MNDEKLKYTSDYMNTPKYFRMLGLIIGAMCIPYLTMAQVAKTETSTTVASNFLGFSALTAIGLQSGTVKLDNVRLRNTPYNVQLPNYHSTGTPWLVGVNYTYVFKNSVTLGGQLEYFPVSQQMAISLTPGFQFNEKIHGYLKFGWIRAPSTVDQGPGRKSYDVDLYGIVAGLGAKYGFTQNLYGFLEVNTAQFQKLNFTSWQGALPIEGSATTRAQNIMLGMGYRF